MLPDHATLSSCAQQIEGGLLITGIELTREAKSEAPKAPSEAPRPTSGPPKPAVTVEALSHTEILRLLEEVEKALRGEGFQKGIAKAKSDDPAKAGLAEPLKPYVKRLGRCWGLSSHRPAGSQNCRDGLVRGMEPLKQRRLQVSTGLVADQKS